MFSGDKKRKAPRARIELAIYRLTAGRSAAELPGPMNFNNQKLIAARFPITKKVFYPNNYDVNAVYHKIKNGDTLGHLARKYHTNTKEICAMNKIKPNSRLRVGSTIRVR